MACSKPQRSVIEEEKNCKLTYFFRDLLERKVCFQISEDEVRDIELAVETLVNDIVRRVANNVEWLGPYKKLRIVKVGSMAEGTSIEYPIEFDFLIILPQDGVKVERVCNQNNRVGYAHFIVFDPCLRSLWKPFISGDYLKGSFSHDFFGKLTELVGFIQSVGKKWLKSDQHSESLFDPCNDSLANAFMSEVVKVIQYSGDLRCNRNLGTLSVGKYVVNHGPAFMPTFIWESKHGSKREITIDLTLAIEVNMFQHGNVVAENETFHARIWDSLVSHGKYLLIPCNESTSCDSGLCFRLTFTVTEIELVWNLSKHHRECYMLLKYIFNSGGGYSYVPSYVFKILVIKHDFHCREDANLADCFKVIVASLLYEISKREKKEQMEPSRFVRILMPGLKFRINISSIFIKQHNILDGKNYPLTCEQFLSTIERMLESLEEINKQDNPDDSVLRIVNGHKTGAQAYANLMVPFMNKKFRLCDYYLNHYFRPYGERRRFQIYQRHNLM